jgi:O-antigen/teichoic acid export membrane protein
MQKQALPGIQTMNSDSARGDNLKIGDSVSKNVAISIPSKVFYMATRVFLPPIILGSVTLEEYGIWACCFILISYFGATSFGLANVYIRHIADFEARGEYQRINHLLSTGLVLVACLGVLILTLLYQFLPLAISWFAIPEGLEGTAFWLFFGTMVAFVLDLSLGLFGYVLLGLQRFYEHTLIWVLSFLLEGILIVVFLQLGFGIFSLLAAFVIRYAFSITGHAISCRRLLPTLRLSPRYLDRDSLQIFFRYGSILQFSGLLATVIYSVEKIIAGFFLGVGAAGLFDLAQKFPVLGSQIPSSMSGVFMPAMARMHSLRRKEELKKLYFRGCRYMSILTGLLMAFIAAFPGPLLTAWLGTQDRFVEAPFIMVCFTLAFQLHVLTGPASALFKGVNRPTSELIYPLVQLGLIGLSIGVASLFWGISVKVIAVTVSFSMVLSALVYLTYTNMVFKVGLATYIRRVILPGLFPYSVALTLVCVSLPWREWANTGRPEAVLFLTGCGGIYAFAVLALIYRLILDRPERAYLNTQRHGEAVTKES